MKLICLCNKEINGLTALLIAIGSVGAIMFFIKCLDNYMTSERRRNRKNRR